MRALLLVAALCESTAFAKPVPPPPEARMPATTEFWRHVIAPHHDEVQSLVAKCTDGLSKLEQVGIDVASRRALASQLIDVLRYARRLEPDNLDVLGTLATAADDIGDARTAREALQAIIDLTGEEHAPAHALDLIGASAIDTGRLDDAIRVLRIAQAPAAGDETAQSVLVHLATALALAGHSGDAVDALAGAAPDRDFGQLAIVGLALVVQYDRDEQRSAALDVIDRMKSELGDQLAPALEIAVDRMRFAPAEDERYYRALVDEIDGDTVEARTEWLLYAADPAAPYRRRALDHVHALQQRGHE